jgi:hypothetical protein
MAWHVFPEPPRQTSSATPPIGEFCVVIYNNAFIYFFMKKGEHKRAFLHTCRGVKRERYIFPPFAFESLRQRGSKDTEALEVPLRKECPVCLSPPFAFESLRQRGSAVRHSIWVENMIKIIYFYVYFIFKIMF